MRKAEIKNVNICVPWDSLDFCLLISYENDRCLVIAHLQTKTGIYLLQDGNEEPFNIRLHLSKDILTIQEQDVMCLSGEPFYSSVGSVETFLLIVPVISGNQVNIHNVL